MTRSSIPATARRPPWVRSARPIRFSGLRWRGDSDPHDGPLTRSLHPMPNARRGPDQLSGARVPRGPSDDHSRVPREYQIEFVRLSVGVDRLRLSRLEAVESQKEMVARHQRGFAVVLGKKGRRAGWLEPEFVHLTFTVYGCPSAAMTFRTEKDPLGEKQVPAD